MKMYIMENRAWGDATCQTYTCILNRHLSITSHQVKNQLLRRIHPNPSLLLNIQNFIIYMCI